MIELLSALDFSSTNDSTADGEEMRGLVNRSLAILAEDGHNLDLTPPARKPSTTAAGASSSAAVVSNTKSQGEKQSYYTDSDSCSGSDSDDDDEHASRSIRLRGSPKRSSTQSSPSPQKVSFTEQQQQDESAAGAQKESVNDIIVPDGASTEMTEEMQLQSVLLMSLREESVITADTTEPGIQENIELLMSAMGVSEDAARNALKQNGYNVEAALNSLLT
jgi:NACalpha-BTF3-like transcription factor